MRKYNGKLVGILGTVILHLIAAIIFMLLQISSLQKTNAKLFSMEIEPVEEVKSEEKKVELPETSIEKILQGDKDMLNIARNLANKSEQKINPSDYIDMVKEEMIKNGQLGKDNYIDEQKKLPENGDEKLAFEDKKEKKPEQDKPTASQEMAANYKGPTRIYYDLAGRTQTYLPIPIYMCEGSGKVVLSIEVDQKGAVESAKIISGESSTDDQCLIETAVNTALMSRFNPDVNSPKSQKGTLTYLFVAQ